MLEPRARIELELCHQLQRLNAAQLNCLVHDAAASTGRILHPMGEF